MTGVLVLGDIPSTGIVGTSAERVVPEPVGVPDSGDLVATAERPSPLHTFVDLIAQRLDQDTVIVAVYPTWRADPALRFIRFARSALETASIVAVAMDLPPLALSLTVDQLAYLAPYVPPGVLVGVAARLAHETLAGAWLSSVARLEHVPTSLGQHVRSYLPGGFMVTARPQQAVHRITGGAPVGEVGFRPAEPVQMLAAQGDGDVEWFQKRLLPYVRPARVQYFQPQPFSSAYWGTRRYVEYVAFSSHPQALTHAAGSVRVRRCRWCDQVVATSTCPFCGMTRHRSSPPTSAADNADNTVHAVPRAAGGQRQAPPSTNHVDGRASALVPEPSPTAGPAWPNPLPSPTEPGNGVP